jgi:hypothetical protein
MFGEPPKQNLSAPLEKGDHPELETSEFLTLEFLDAKGIKT